MVLEHSDYRAFLRSALAERRKKNPAYSMRAFALQVGLTQSALSQVMSGKKNLSTEAATRIANKLNLNESESEYFRVLIQIEKTRNPDLKKALVSRAQELNPKREIRELTLEFFNMIADWYHIAIKNMVELDSFEFTPSNVASRLGIPKIVAEAAIDRLIRLEVIEEKKPSGYKRTESYTLTRSAVPNEALRRFHRQMLEKAIESLETQTPKEKIIGSETFPISEDLMEEANQIVEKFFREMQGLSEKSLRRTQVYHLGVQFFNLTKGRKKS